MDLIVRDTRIHLVERGSGEPVLLLHGAPDSSMMWDGLIQRLEGHYHCFAPDLPGWGESVAPAHFDYSLSAMARFMDELIVAAAIPTPLNLVVTDFGASYGLAWAVTHPEKVRSIAIVGSVSFFPDYRWHQNARLLRMPLLGELGMALLTAASFEKMMRQNAPQLSPEHIRATYARSLTRWSGRRTMLRMYRSLNMRDFVGWEDRLLALTAHVPTSVLWGDKDPFIAPQFAERFGTTRVEHFPDNGHWLAVEEPALVAQRLSDFLAEVYATTARP